MGGVFAPERAANVRALARLIERAHREEAVRPDLTLEDFHLVLVATAARRGSALDTERAPIEAHRLAALLLQGMRAQPAAALEPLPTTAA
jgi:hypothetical protein